MTVAASRRLVARLPEPAGLWIAQSPRGWQASDGPWVDWASARLVRGRNEASWQPLTGAQADQVVYLPPFAPHLAHEREDALVALGAVPAVTLVQLRPGEPSPSGDAALGVYDLLPSLLGDALDDLDRLPTGSVAVWPLIAGLTDEPDRWADGCARLARAGVRTVQAMAVDVTPIDRQWLAEGRDESVFDRLFHGPAPDERAFARTAARHGLAPFVERPTLGTGRVARNHAIGAALALAGELWLRLGRRESVGQAFLRAARGADGTSYDLQALAEDGNLTVLDWLDDESRSVVDDVLADGRSTLVERLEAAYVAADPG